MIRDLETKINDDGIVIISKEKGFTIKELKGILSFADSFVTTNAPIYMDMISNSEQEIKEIRIDDLGVTIYDTIN